MSISSISSSKPSVSSVCPETELCRILPFRDKFVEEIESTSAVQYLHKGGFLAPLFRLVVEAGKSITFVGAKKIGQTTFLGTIFQNSIFCDYGAVALHEIMHVWGGDHISDSNNFMYGEGVVEFPFVSKEQCLQLVKGRSGPTGFFGFEPWE